MSPSGDVVHQTLTMRSVAVMQLVTMIVGLAGLVYHAGTLNQRLDEQVRGLGKTEVLVRELGAIVSQLAQERSADRARIESLTDRLRSVEDQLRARPARGGTP